MTHSNLADSSSTFSGPKDSPEFSQIVSSSNEKISENEIVSRIQHWIDHSDLDLASSDSDAILDIQFCERLLKTGTIMPWTLGSNPASDVNDTAPNSCVTQSLASLRFLDAKFMELGGFGVVFRATDAQLGVQVAVKILRPSKSASAEASARFLGEAQTTAWLSHPGIVRVFDVGKLDSNFFYTARWIQDGSLARALAEKRIAFSPRQAAWFVLQVSQAVAHAHALATLHRDIKPGYILIETCAREESEGLGVRPILTDFGLSKRTDDSSAKCMLTSDGTTLGTSRYMSPEQVLGKTKEIGTRSDLFSIGTILYELATGKHPFDHANAHTVRQKIVTISPANPRWICPTISSELEAIMLKCLSRNPNDRYGNVGELILDLQRYLDGRPVEARKHSSFTRFLLWVRRRPYLAAVLTGTLALNMAALLGLAFSLQLFRSALELETQAKGKVQRALFAETDAKDRQAEAAAEYESTLIEIVGTYSNVTDKIIAGKPVEIYEIMSSLESTAQRIENLVQKDSSNPSLLHRLSVLKHYLGIGYQREQKYDRAVQLREEVIAILDRLLSHDSANTKYRFQRFFALLVLSDLYRQTDTGNLTSKSRSMIDQALEQITQLEAEYPDNVDYADAVNATKRTVARIVGFLDLDLCLRYYDEAIEGSKLIAEKHPDQPLLIKHAILGLSEKASILRQAKRTAEAIQNARLSIELFEQHRRPIPDETAKLDEAIVVLTVWLDTLRTLEKWDEAVVLSREVISLAFQAFSHTRSEQSIKNIIDLYNLHLDVLDGLGEKREDESQFAERIATVVSQQSLSDPHLLDPGKTYPQCVSKLLKSRDTH